jgi:hypothetical protein
VQINFVERWLLSMGVRQTLPYDVRLKRPRPACYKTGALWQGKVDHFHVLYHIIGSIALLWDV